jgi:hypothetical protein
MRTLGTREVAMVALRISAACAILMLGAFAARPACAASTVQDKTREDSQDAQRETEWRAHELALLKLEHSDTTGKVRPDLRAKAIAQMQRMKVVTQFGASTAGETTLRPSNTPPVKK